MSVTILNRHAVRAILARRWAARIRAENGWAATCGRPGHLVSTEFRRGAGLQDIDECRLRELAAQQAADSAKVAWLPAIASPETAAVLAAIKVAPQTCPGEYGPGGTWQPHCTTSTEEDSP